MERIQREQTRLEILIDRLEVFKGEKLTEEMLASPRQNRIDTLTSVINRIQTKIDSLN